MARNTVHPFFAVMLQHNLQWLAHMLLSTRSADKRLAYWETTVAFYNELCSVGPVPRAIDLSYRLCKIFVVVSMAGEKDATASFDKTDKDSVFANLVRRPLKEWRPTKWRKLARLLNSLKDGIVGLDLRPTPPSDDTNRDDDSSTNLNNNSQNNPRAVKDIYTTDLTRIQDCIRSQIVVFPLRQAVSKDLEDKDVDDADTLDVKPTVLQNLTRRLEQENTRVKRIFGQVILNQGELRLAGEIRRAFANKPFCTSRLVDRLKHLLFFWYNDVFEGMLPFHNLDPLATAAGSPVSEIVTMDNRGSGIGRPASTGGPGINRSVGLESNACQGGTTEDKEVGRRVRRHDSAAAKDAIRVLQKTRKKLQENVNDPLKDSIDIAEQQDRSRLVQGIDEETEKENLRRGDQHIGEAGRRHRTNSGRKQPARRQNEQVSDFDDIEDSEASLYISGTSRRRSKRPRTDFYKKNSNAIQLNFESPGGYGSAQDGMASSLSSFSTARPRRAWTPEETQALRLGIQKFGFGRWKDIKIHFSEQLCHRTTVNIKDRARTLKNTMNDSLMI